MNPETGLFPLSPKARLLRDEPLAPITSFRIGGPAEILLIPAEVADVNAALAWATAAGRPWRVIGSGTNILVPDEGLPGLTIKFWHHFTAITVSGNTISAQAGADMLSLALRAAEGGLAGLEWACGIPGTVGGSVYMNAGIPGAEIRDTLATATILETDGRVREYSSAEMQFSYRTSILQKTGGVVLAARFDLLPEPLETIYEKMNRTMATRKAGQPLHQPNCGSVFRNPPGEFAGRLIEAAGLKGFRLGGVMVSEQHANFIVNCGEGRARDVAALIDLIRERVRQQTGILLEPEVRFIR